MKHGQIALSFPSPHTCFEEEGKGTGIAAPRRENQVLKMACIFLGLHVHMREKCKDLKPFPTHPLSLILQANVALRGWVAKT